MEKHLILTQWQAEKTFLKSAMRYFFIAGVLFCLSLIVVAVILWQNPHLLDGVNTYIQELFGDAFKNIKTSHDTFFFILSNNVRAMAVMIIWGILPFLFIPSLSALLNGGMLSAVWFLSADKGMSVAAYFAFILPHGIFEIPGMIISCGTGLYLCYSMTKKIIAEKPIKAAFINAFRTYLIIVLPLTVIAAVIEAYITPLIGAIFL